uniref:Methylenetetrahydrofolate dehydrogenase (NADP+ dependent) 2 like n=1 Tax=Amphiprion percula TaxID=161767 RepID=A0A3P8T826_AMPPE
MVSFSLTVKVNHEVNSDSTPQLFSWTSTLGSLSSRIFQKLLLLLLLCICTFIHIFTIPLSRHAAVVISGTELARQLHREIQRDVEELVAQGNMRPHLGVVLVGDDPASRTYVKNKTRAASILEHINERAVCNAIAPEKDVDGFHIVNIGKLCLDQRSMVPATPAAVWEIIKRAGIETVGKNVLVAGRSKNVGMPIAMLLHTDRNHERPGGDATVTIAHRCTPRERLEELTSLADIIIAAAGVKEKAGFITPVPGGVGPMTVAMLMKNTVTAARNERTFLKCCSNTAFFVCV